MNHEELHIIASILSGRTEQFAYFLDTYGPQVFHLIVRMVGSPEDAEELTHVEKAVVNIHDRFFHMCQFFGIFR